MPVQLIADSNPGDASWSTSVASHVVAAAGTATVLNGATTATVLVPAGLSGSPVTVSFAEAPTAASIVHASVGAGPPGSSLLTITINVNNTADLDVHYAVYQTLA